MDVKDQVVNPKQSETSQEDTNTKETKEIEVTEATLMADMMKHGDEDVVKQGENIATAKDLKELGNTLFKEGNVKKALGKYTHIFLYVNGYNTNISGILNDTMTPPTSTPTSPSPSPPVAKPARTPLNQAAWDLKFSANLNCSVCYFKLGQFDNAIKFAQQVKIYSLNYQIFVSLFNK